MFHLLGFSLAQILKVKMLAIEVAFLFHCPVTEIVWQSACILEVLEVKLKCLNTILHLGFKLVEILMEKLAEMRVVGLFLYLVKDLMWRLLPLVMMMEVLTLATFGCLSTICHHGFKLGGILTEKMLMIAVVIQCHCPVMENVWQLGQCKMMMGALMLVMFECLNMFHPLGIN